MKIRKKTFKLGKVYEIKWKNRNRFPIDIVKVTEITDSYVIVIGIISGDIQGDLIQFNYHNKTIDNYDLLTYAKEL